MTDRSNGYIALITVLVVGAAGLAIALTILMSGVGASESGLVTQQATQARALSNACAEEGLAVWRSNPAYTGTTNMSLGAGTCSYTVTRTANNTLTLDATGTVNDIVRKSKVYVTIGASSISITSWQDVI